MYHAGERIASEIRSGVDRNGRASRSDESRFPFPPDTWHRLHPESSRSLTPLRTGGLSFIRKWLYPAR